MGLTHWPPPPGRTLVHSPRPASIDCLLLGATVEYQDRPERLLDILFRISSARNPFLEKGGRLRPLVRCWLGSILRFWDKIIEDLVHDHPVIAAVRVSVVNAGLTGSRPGEAEAWITTAGVTVREKFASDNRSILSLPGGEGGMASVVAGQANLSSTCAHLGARIGSLVTDFRDFKTEVRADLTVVKGGLAELLQASHMLMNAPPRAPLRSEGGVGSVSGVGSISSSSSASIGIFQEFSLTLFITVFRLFFFNEYCAE